MYRIGFDVGGTFTDFTLHDTTDGTLRHFKVPSTPADPSEAIEAGLATLMRSLDIAAATIGFVGHGTTVATNMVIERRGVPTGLITTRGFRDVLEIGRQVRPHLYDYTVRTPLPLVPRERRLEVAERIDASGAVLLPLDEAAVAAAADALAAQGVQAIAICFLHSYLNDSHERRAADIVRARLPDVYLSTSSGVLPEFREFERFSTTAINAYIGPRMERYLDRFLGRLSGLGLTVQPYTIHSNGGLMSVDSVRQFPVRCCLSGPAAGVVGAAEAARDAGFSEVITFDAGGTSTDVSLIERGVPAFASSRTIADYPVRSPMVDVHVIGAGGGSIAWLDDAGALKVGPQSAGADPGPVAYGRGGGEPTLTDANIVLHRLDPVALLGGRMPVDEMAARRAIADRIAAPMGLSVEDAALGIVRIAVANMSRAIRSVSTEKGHDVAEFALFPYGGAGPLHAAAVAAECSIGRVLVPVEPGTLCARGILLSDVSLDLVRSQITTADLQNWPGILQRFAAMQSSGRAWLDGEHIASERRRFAPVIDARYKGQNHEVQVRLADEALHLGDFVAAFEESHRREYGYDIPGRAIEVVNCRLKAVGLIDRPAPHFVGTTAAAHARAARQVHFDSGWIETPIFDRAELAVGARLSGPAVVDEMSATTLVPTGWDLSVDRSGNLLLEMAV
ncbi:MAG TPA: hydantoinase/oxoprolinase family protein [Acetobacteraceae bacterium]|jgi:N-methylhydantoinase A|nr:hydantoinase/oxoprolinase family protein [Acetobacteraceae bacterium]